MKTKLMVVTTIAFGAMELAVSAMTDAEMRRRIEGSAYVFDNPDMATAELRYVLRCCEYDTNRFLSAMQAVAVEKPKLSDYICHELGKYGNASCLPFLYQNLTNSAARSYAALSVLKIEGLTSNSIDRIGMYLSCQSAGQMDRGFVCGEMVSLAAQNCISNVIDLVVSGKISKDEFRWFRYGSRNPHILGLLPMEFDRPGVSNIVLRMQECTGETNYCQRILSGAAKEDAARYLDGMR